MKKLSIVMFGLALAGACFAPINLPYRPANGVRPDVATEDQLRQQQMNQQRIGNLGGVPDGTERRDDLVPPRAGEPDAATTVATAEIPNDPEASQNLKKAEENVKNEKSGPFRMLMWVLFLGAFGFAVMVGVRKWADKAIPEVKYR